MNSENRSFHRKNQTIIFILDEKIKQTQEKENEIFDFNHLYMS